MSRVLIFGLWKQGRKHYDYFSSRGYEVVGVTKTGETTLNPKQILSFEEIQSKNRIFFQSFSYIIVSVYPYENQNEVINFLIDYHLTSNIIIEKPVVTDIEIFSRIQDIENIYYFIDEAYFSPLFAKKDIANTEIISYCSDYEVFEHAMWFFLLREDFWDLLKKMEVKIEDMWVDYTSLYYKTILWKYEIVCDRWTYSINGKVIGEHIFEKSLDFFTQKLCVYKEINKIYKRNFFTLQQYIHDKGGYI